MPPLVSVIVPLFNDEDHVASALRSCLAQTIAEIEVIVVDDGSTDGTASIVAEIAAADERVRLLCQGANRSAFQARRRGIENSRGSFVMFLDGDDELVPHAVEAAFHLARAQNADIVAFGAEVVKADGSTGGSFEADLQPTAGMIEGDEIVRHLFPIGKRAQGQLWRYLFEVELVRKAYQSLDADLVLPRANDIPIAFLAAVHAKKYVSTTEKLYRYYFRRGASGHRIKSIDDFEFAAAAIKSIDAIGAAVEREAENHPESDELARIYTSVRRSIIGHVLTYVREISDPRLRSQALSMLEERVGRLTLVLAATDFSPKSVAELVGSAPPLRLGGEPPRHILLRATNLGTGGAQGVVAAQATHLAAVGYQVTIGLDSPPMTNFQLAEQIEVVHLFGESLAERVAFYADYISKHDVDLVIDHYVFYNDRWPFFALAANSHAIPTIGWLHNFALRPLVDGSRRLSALEKTLPLLAATVVLSEVDRLYWELQGVENVMYIPNPPSPLIADLPQRTSAHEAPSAGPIELAWWGRLQQSTKQVRELIEIGYELKQSDVPFRLTIIGPDGDDLKANDLLTLAEERGLAEDVVLEGALHGDELRAVIARSHVFVSTSFIEGYPLVLTEAQVFGLPVVAYDMPWLALVEGNGGIISVESGDRAAAAQAIASLASDPERYAEVSAASIKAAEAAMSHDFAAYYDALVRGADASPEPLTDPRENMRILLKMHVRYHERNVGKNARALARAREAASKAQKRLATAKVDSVNSRKRISRLFAERDAARAEIQMLRDEISRSAARLANMRPSVARTGLRGMLQRIVPASAYQTSFFARHQHRVSAELLAIESERFTALTTRLARIETTLVRIDQSSSAASEQTSL